MHKVLYNNSWLLALIFILSFANISKGQNLRTFSDEAIQNQIKYSFIEFPNLKLFLGNRTNCNSILKYGEEKNVRNDYFNSYEKTSSKAIKYYAKASFGSFIFNKSAFKRDFCKDDITCKIYFNNVKFENQLSYSFALGSFIKIHKALYLDAGFDALLFNYGQEIVGDSTIPPPLTTYSQHGDFSKIKLQNHVGISLNSRKMEMGFGAKLNLFYISKNEIKYTTGNVKNSATRSSVLKLEPYLCFGYNIGLSKQNAFVFTQFEYIEKYFGLYLIGFKIYVL